MELREYVAILRKRWPSILLFAGLALAGAALASLLATPKYVAGSQLFVSAQASGSAADLLQGSNFTQQRVKSYAEVVTTPLVLDPVIEDLGLDETADELAARVTANVPLDTVLIDVTVTDTDPESAAEIANAISTSFVEAVGDLEPGTAGGSAVQVTRVQPAQVPTDPDSPDTRLNLALGLVVGLALGVGIAVLREVMDTRVRGESDVRQVTDASILGGIAFDQAASKRPLIIQDDPQSTRAEAFRTLRTNLKFVDVANHPRSFVITSSVPAEGKSTTAANLALALAEAGSRVCLVEGDLRRPRIAEYLGLDNAVGLTTVLIGQADLVDVIQPWGSEGRLSVLASGQIPPNPSELLGSARMEELLRQLEHGYDIVLVDAPPLLPVTDAALLSALAGGAVLVVGAEKITRDQLTKSLSNLEAVDARLLGIVMNMLPSKGPDAYSYYRYEYASESSPKGAPDVLPTAGRRGTGRGDR